MHRVVKFLGERCDRYTLCTYARQHPDTWVVKIMAWHGKWCPAWQAQQHLEKESQGKPS